MVSAPAAAQDAVQKAQDTFDVVVIGAGPAGLSLAAALGKRGVSTLCVDPTLDKAWPNNYGTWLDDLEPLGLHDCTANVWDITSVFTKRSGEKTSLPRAYARVDRKKLKTRLLDLCAASNCVQVCKAAAQNVDTSSSTKSTVTIKGLEDAPILGAQEKDAKLDVSAQVVVDATGHNLKFVKLEQGKVPGYQAAYGIDCDVKETMQSYSADEMLLMDYRDDHMQASEKDRKRSHEEPTFLYVMPLDNGRGRRVFFEETSLVATVPMDFEVLKERLYKRLRYYNIDVEKIHEEEFCLIPMGGGKPSMQQRVVAFGGAAAFVHPATGYMIARALKLAERVGEGISRELKAGGSVDDISQRIWKLTWNDTMLRQRDFLSFGGEYLQKIDLDATRDFFTAFFKLPVEQWAGYLSFRLEEPLERIAFGLGVFFHTSNRVRAWLVWDALTAGGWPFFQSLLPLPSGDTRK